MRLKCDDVVITDYAEMARFMLSKAKKLLEDNPRKEFVHVGFTFKRIVEEDSICFDFSPI